MTLFKDVIQSLLTGLDDLNTKAKAAVDQYNSDTTNDQNYVTSNITGEPGSIFLGKGADACINAINRNVARAQHGTTKLGDFQLACEQTKKSLEDLCSSFDNQSIYYLKTSEMGGLIDFKDADPNRTWMIDYFRQAQGYSVYDTTDPSAIIVWRIREDTLPGLSFDLDSLLTPGKGQGILEDSINYAVSCIQGDFQSYQSQRHSDLQAELQQGMDKGAYQVYNAYVDSSYNEAMHYVNIIAGHMKSGYTEWVMEVQATIGQFQTDVVTASDIKALTIGDLTTEITTGPYKNAKVIILQTPHGLVVVVKGGADQTMVEQDIQQYLNDNGLPSTTAITMFGYEGGGDIAQNVIKDGGYKVTDLVLVGAQLNDTLPGNIDVTTYQQAPKETKEQEATFLGLKPDQIFIPLATGAVLFFATGGIGDIAEAGVGSVLLEKGGEIGTEYAASEIWNAAANQWNAQHPGEQMLVPEPPTTTGPQLFVDDGNGQPHPMTRQEFYTIQQAGLTHQPLPKDWRFYMRQNSYVPEESGANLNSFTNSSYLNSQVVN